MQNRPFSTAPSAFPRNAAPRHPGIVALDKGRALNSVLYSAMFEHVRASSDFLDIPLARRIVIDRYARDFLAATIRRRGGQDVPAAQSVLAEVHQLGLTAEFDRMLAKDGGVEGVLRREFKGGLIARLFKPAIYKECLDIWRTGTKQYSATAGEYRRFGLWQSLTDFAEVCKARPLISAAVIALVGYFGGRHPFLGGISGLVIAAWSSTATLIHEIKAGRNKPMTSERAGHFIQSGENIMAFLLTMSGIDEIVKGTRLGVRAFKTGERALKSGNPLAKSLWRTWDAIKISQPFGFEHPVSALRSVWGWFAKFRFVMGLFDNVLLPFNWAADKLNLK